MYNETELQFKNVVYKSIDFTEESLSDEFVLFLKHLGEYDVRIHGPYFYSIENVNGESGKIGGKIFLSLEDDKVTEFGDDYYFQSYFQINNIIKKQYTLGSSIDLKTEYGRLVYESLEQNRQPITPIYTILINVEEDVSAIAVLGTN